MYLFHSYLPWRHILITFCSKRFPHNETAAGTDHFMYYKSRLWLPSNQTHVLYALVIIVTHY